MGFEHRKGTRPLEPARKRLSRHRSFVTSFPAAQAAIIAPMPEIPAPEPRPRRQRAFRVKLRGSILALLRLPNKREVRARVHQISISGGLMNVDTPLDEKLQVELIFHLGEVTIREKAEMLFPMWATQGWLQPFRFIDVAEANKDLLESNLMAFVQQTQASTQSDSAPLANAAEAS